MKIHAYDYVVLGGGAAGLVAAKLAHGLGKKVCIIDRKRLGGECTWTGCIPSKALIHVANTAENYKRLQAHGIASSDDVTLSGPRVMDYVRSCVREIAATHKEDDVRELGIDVVLGEPEFIDAYMLWCDSKTISFKQLLVATGSSPFIPPIDGLESIDYLTNQNIFDLEQLPRSLAIIGGGPIGVELGSACARLGTSVTIIEREKRLMMHDDMQLTTKLTERLREQGVNLLTSTQVQRVEKTDDGVAIMCDQERTVTAQHVLVAAGRTPNIVGSGLDRFIECTKKGIVVDMYQRTSRPHIYAAGDVCGLYQFTHMAERQAIVATKNAFLPFMKKIDYSRLCWVTFAGPELAASGMTTQEMAQRPGRHLVYSFSYEETNRGVVDDARDGHAVFITDTKGYLLGTHILGKRAGELLHIVQVAKENKVPLHKLEDLIFAYPTFAGVIKKAARMSYLEYIQSRWYVRLLKKVFMR